MDETNATPVVQLPTLDVGTYDAFRDEIVIEGIRYSGGLFREFGIRGMPVGSVFRIEHRSEGALAVYRFPIKESTEEQHLSEAERLVEDALMLRWLLAHAPAQIAGIAYRVPEACAHGDAREALSAAMKARPLPL